MNTVEKAPLEHSQWLSEKVFTSASEYFDQLISDIAKAKSTIDLDYYIFELDKLGLRVIDALKAAAQRGVTVRLIIDGIGSTEDAEALARSLEHTGCNIRIYHPHPLYPEVFRWSIKQGNAFQKFAHFFFNVNNRDHHKLCIIDKTIIWSGSLNITARHLKKSEGGEGWHDYGVRLEDNDTQEISEAFESVWNDVEQNENTLKTKRFLTYFRKQSRNTAHQIFNERFIQAKQRIWISNAYFAPNRHLLKCLIRARQKGVDVRLILPSTSDVSFFPIISRTYYPKLLKKGIKIYEYQPSILHSKAILFDTDCLIGSTNLNHRSYYHDLELDIVLTHEKSIRTIEANLKRDMIESRKIHLEELDRQPFKLIIGRLLRLFKYWM